MKKTIHQLQILRFVAATMVLISHVQHEVLDKPFLDVAGYQPFNPLFWAGGVDIFFVISGFIMYHLAQHRFGVPDAPKEFMIRRLARVAPPYWVVTILMLVAMQLFAGHVTHAAPSLQQVVGSFLFLPLPDPYGKFYPIMILGWTLNFEMLFYVVFGIGLFFSKRIGLVFIVSVLAFLGILPFVTTITTAPLAFWANPIVFEFLFGIALAHLRAKGVRFSPAVGWGLFLLGFAMMIGLKAAGIVEDDYLLRFLWMGVPAFVICAGPALIREAPGEGRLSFGQRALVFGGDASFALYLTHPFSINAVAIAVPRLGITQPWTYFAIACIVALLAAALAYLLFERPLTSVINNRLSRRRPVVMSQVPSSR